jgi:hypothetical protein
VPIARNFDTDQPVQGVYDFNRQVFEEDAAMVEAQWPAHVPLDPLAEAHLAADMSSMFYRRALKDMGLRRLIPGLQVFSARRCFQRCRSRRLTPPRRPAGRRGAGWPSGRGGRAAFRR